MFSKTSSELQDFFTTTSFSFTAVCILRTLEWLLCLTRDINKVFNLTKHSQSSSKVCYTIIHLSTQVQYKRLGMTMKDANADGCSFPSDKSTSFLSHHVCMHELVNRFSTSMPTEIISHVKKFKHMQPRSESYLQILPLTRG